MYITVNGKRIEYTLERKKVKNINVRIKQDGSIYVSANRRVPASAIEAFLYEKSEFITRALERIATAEDAPLTRFFSNEELQNTVKEICDRVYPYFKGRGVAYPVIKYRAMTSRWGSCHPTKKTVTFNTYLAFAPYECVEYVVLHEFVHFLQANHSDKFYDELVLVCPDWKERRARLKRIHINKEKG